MAQMGRIRRPSDADRNLLPRIGNIRVGTKNDRGIPISLDHFIATGNYSQYFDDVYGEKPKTIQIVFMSNEYKHSCEERLEYRDDSGKLIAHGDGVAFEVYSEKVKGYVTMDTENPSQYMIDNDIKDVAAWVTQTFPNKKSEKEGETGWDETLTMRFIIPRIPMIAGLWQFSTKGTNSSLPTIRNAFDQVMQARGSVVGFLFDMNVEMAKSNKPNDKRRYPVVTLVPNMSEQNIKLVKSGMAVPDMALAEGYMKEVQSLGMSQKEESKPEPEPKMIEAKVVEKPKAKPEPKPTEKEVPPTGDY